MVARERELCADDKLSQICTLLKRFSKHQQPKRKTMAHSFVSRKPGIPLMMAIMLTNAGRSWGLCAQQSIISF